jgi:outer membrane protein OmpA-like peptidoglycan-associated protein
MKKFITLFLVLGMSIGISVKSFSQTADYPWAIGLGIHWTSFSDINLPIQDQFKDMKFQGGPIEVSVSRYLTPYFNMQLTGGYLSLARGEYANYSITAKNYWYFDLDGQLKFLGGAIKEDALITPYLYFGFGDQKMNEVNDLKAQTGLGVDIKIVENLSLYARADYVFSTNKEGISYIHPHAGLKYRFTCKKDMDKDGIVDEEDRCPEVFGLASLKGCPDRDGDGIADIDDKCPDVKGLAAFQGCPDRDGDGITDSEDRCPDASGSKALNGCPDKDKDGIADIDDNCPDVAGIAKFKGCPDTDGDGITDKEDACPTVAGLAAFKGCPDTDGDGIIDKEDKCPLVPGTIANHGCPDVTPVEKEQITKIAKAIYFATGKDIIKKESEAPLNELIPILLKYPEMILKIEGNTDNVGKDELNLKLSQDRANAVKKYLEDKGIAAARLTAIGNGETKPLADNATAKGRAENRRVDLTTEY